MVPLLFACRQQPSEPETMIDDPRDTTVIDDPRDTLGLSFRLINCTGDTVVIDADSLRLRWQVDGAGPADSVFIAYRRDDETLWRGLGTVAADQSAFDIDLRQLSGESWNFMLHLRPADAYRFTGTVSRQVDTSRWIVLDSPRSGDFLRKEDSVFFAWHSHGIAAGHTMWITAVRMLDGLEYTLRKCKVGDGKAVAVLPQIRAGEAEIRITIPETGESWAFGPCWVYGIRILGLEKTTELYRGASERYMTCDPEWPPELSPRPTLRLSWSSDRGQSWTLWSYDVSANFIDLPAMNECLFRLSAPEIASADTAGPFRIIDQTEQLIRYEVGQKLRFERWDVEYLGQNRYEHYRYAVCFHITGATEEADRTVFHAVTWHDRSGVLSDSSAATIVQERGGFQDITGNRQPFHVGIIHGRYSTAVTGMIAYKAGEPAPYSVIFYTDTRRLSITLKASTTNWSSHWYQTE